MNHLECLPHVICWQLDDCLKCFQFVWPEIGKPVSRVLWQLFKPSWSLIRHVNFP